MVVPFEQVDGVLGHPGEPAVLLLQAEREIEPRRGPAAAHRPQAQALDLQARDGSVLEREHHLEQGRVGEAPLRRQLLDELFERYVLVRMSGQCSLADPAEQLPECGLVGQIAA